jgi:hypothetical protein
VASWLKHEPLPNDKPWRRIIPVDEKAINLALFIPRLRYAYETYNGKTRRIGFLLEIMMEDPVIPEDEIRLKKQMELMQLQQGTLKLDTYRIAESVNANSSKLPQLHNNSHNREKPDTLYVNPALTETPMLANQITSDLHNRQVNPEFSGLLGDVKQHNVGLMPYVNQADYGLEQGKPAKSGTNVNELDILIQQLKTITSTKTLRKASVTQVINLTEELLDDQHSTAMLYKVLSALYPHRLDLYVAAVRVALESAEDDPQVNRGAVFVRALREFAEVAGVDLGLKRSITEMMESEGVSEVGEPGFPTFWVEQPVLTPPSVTEAIWAETQQALRRQMTQATYDAIIQRTVLLQYVGNQYVVGVHSDMAKEWLENRLHDIVQRALSNVVGRPVKIEFRLLNGLSQM